MLRANSACEQPFAPCSADRAEGLFVGFDGKSPPRLSGRRNGVGYWLGRGPRNRWAAFFPVVVTSGPGRTSSRVAKTNALCEDNGEQGESRTLNSAGNPASCEDSDDARSVQARKEA
jgi:hypothetical protein